MAENHFPEKQLNEFVERLQKDGGDNLESVVLYGSAVTGEYDPEFSNINLMCILRDASYANLKVLSSAVESWFKEGHRPPLFITREELERSTDVFVIELMDLRRQHRVLFGADYVGALEIPMKLHRAQLEYELREKLILLRQNLLLAGSDHGRIWELMLRSLPAFATLCRHAVIAQGQPVPATKRDAIEQLAASLTIDATPFLTMLDIRERRVDRGKFKVSELAGQYLAAAEKVTAAVDRRLDKPQIQGS